mmetsp:Transcript_19546/g.51234  ORF Transcript_19546/g.51234 Transcript_19546/m.51234 type:complete len:296 (+) Transcript_19546:90-977(+)
MVEELARTGGVSPLDQREVGAAEHGLRLAKRVDFVGTRLLAYLEVLEEPVALGMEAANVFGIGHKLLESRLVLLLGRQHALFGRGLRALLILKRLRIQRALLRRICHELLVVLLRVLLLGLTLGHLLVQVLHQQVDHADDAIALLALVRVGAEGLRGRGRRGLGAAAVQGNLHEGCRSRDGNTSACDATRSLSRRRRPTIVHSNAVLLGKLLLRSGLVELGVIKLVHAVLGEQDQLLGRAVAGHEVLVLSVLRLALLRGLRDGLVQGSDAHQERRDLLRGGRDALLGLFDDRLEV